MRKIIYIIIVIVVAIIFFSLDLKNINNPKSDTSNQTGSNETSNSESENIDVLKLLETDPNSQKTSLVTVNGSNSSGTAYKLIKNGIFYHAIIATMPDPAPGNNYEGWLVRPSPLNFFSTGVMNKDKNEKWVLIYQQAGDVPANNRVVITEETVVDPTPEIHIIEGDF